MPCLIRDFNGEADVLLSMIAENTQRSEGLNIVGAAERQQQGGMKSAATVAAASSCMIGSTCE